MTRDDIIKLARELGCEIPSGPDGMEFFFYPDELVRFAALIAAAEREKAAHAAGEYARKWWSRHSATNKHMTTTLEAHQDFCALQSAIRARGNT